jgi:hypothetical protein
MEAGLAALAKCLGPVASMFEAEAASLHKRTLPLRDDVKQLSPGVFKRLLASEALQVQIENEPYHLRAWLRQSLQTTSKHRQRALFKELAPLLRYHHMTSDFLASAVAQCSMVRRSGLLPLVMQASHAHREALPSLLEEENVVRGSPDRGVALSEACWELKASFSLEEVAALRLGGFVWKWCGLVAGYAAGLSVQRTKDKDTLGAFLRINVPKPENALEGGPAAGVRLKFELALSPDVKHESSAYFTGLGFGFPDFFDKPWAESVREGSPHFPGGKLEFKVNNVKLAVKE